jgi:hypothetical protein
MTERSMIDIGEAIVRDWIENGEPPHSPAFKRAARAQGRKLGMTEEQMDASFGPIDELELEHWMRERAARGDPQAAMDILDGLPSEPPLPGDEMPED